MGALGSWKTLVRTLNLIISAKSLLPYKVVFAGSGGQDLDVFERALPSLPQEMLVDYLEKTGSSWTSRSDVGAGGGAEVGTMFGCNRSKAEEAGRDTQKQKEVMSPR